MSTLVFRLRSIQNKAVPRGQRAHVGGLWARALTLLGLATTGQRRESWPLPDSWTESAVHHPRQLIPGSGTLDPQTFTTVSLIPRIYATG